MALVVDYYPWLTARNTFSFGSIFSFLLFGLVVEAFQGTVKDTSNILAIIFSSRRGRILVAKEDFFNGIEGVLIMLGFNSISEG